MFNLVNTVVPSSFLQVRRTTIKSRVCSKYGPIRPQTAELAALATMVSNDHELVHPISETKMEKKIDIIQSEHTVNRMNSVCTHTATYAYSSDRSSMRTLPPHTALR